MGADHTGEHPVAVDGCMDCLELAMEHDVARRGRTAAPPPCGHTTPHLGCQDCLDWVQAALVASVPQQEPRPPAADDAAVARSCKVAAAACADLVRDLALAVRSSPDAAGSERMMQVARLAAQVAEQLDRVGDKAVAR